MSIEGRIDIADRTRVTGWAFNRASPDQPVALECWIGSELLLRLHATQFRADLRSAGLGAGRCAFSITIPGGLASSEAHTLRIVAAETGLDLKGSPVTLPPAPQPEAGLLTSLPAHMRELGAYGTQHEQDALLRVLLRQTDTMIRTRAATGDLPGGMDVDAFYARWGAFLDGSPPPPRRASRALHPHRPRALLILPTWSAAGHPLIRALANALPALEYEPHAIASLSQAANGAVPPDALIRRGAPFTATVEELLGREAGLFDAVLLAGTETALQYAALVRRHMPNARLLFLALALESEQSLARANAEARPELLHLAQAQRLREAMAVWSTEGVLAATSAIRMALLDSVPDASIATLPDDAGALSHTLRTLLPGARGEAALSGEPKATNDTRGAWEEDALF